MRLWHITIVMTEGHTQSVCGVSTLLCTSTCKYINGGHILLAQLNTQAMVCSTL